MHLHTDLSIPLGQEQVHIPKGALRPGKDWTVQRHCNAEWEFHFIRSGTCLVDIDQQQYLLSQGDALLIEPGRYHQAGSCSGAFQRFTISFLLESGSLQRQLVQRLKQNPVFTTDEKITGTITRIMDEQEGRPAFSETYLHAQISCLMVELMRCLGISSEPTPANRETNDRLVTEIIDNYFEQHFADACGETVLAKELHFSRRHLVRILKKHYGMSFREKLNHTRMDYAAFLLRTTDRPVGNIGEDVGYSSESAFFKVFRQSFHMTPRQYRAANKKK